ncbi:AidA/PixA family protein [Xenorhabdus budapestensis]|uniref:Inclusion body protein n=1 Tax=Xenorhabdus budapestensis TaxID=290110 RepID=A0A2D0IMM0_XENBU|nr:AidA/PixA family protein [Xenorhabdus budapestensis]PHM23033.1 hypothetical protein Xbud_03682 [Xenorhabdus budapestensis]
MADVIDILVAIDEKVIVRENQYNKNPSKPELVDSKYVHVMTYDESLITDNHGEQLTLLSIARGDQIRWRGISLSPVDSPYSAILTSFLPDNVADYDEYLSRATRKPLSKNVPVVQAGTGNIGFQVVPNDYWLSEVKKSPVTQPVTLPSTGYFTIYDQTSQPIGYCKWHHTLVLVS